MSTVTKSTTLTLNGKTNFTIDGQLHDWSNDGFIVGVDIWSDTNPAPTVTAVLTGEGWSISTLRFINNVKTVITDKTTGDGAYFNHIRFDGPSTTATFTKSSAGAIEGGSAGEKITFADGWVGSMHLRGGNDIVTTGSGGADYINLGDGNNTVKTGSGFVGAIAAYNGNDKFTGGSGEVEMVNLGSGTNTVTATSGWIGTVIGYGGIDTFIGGAGDVDTVNLGSGNNVIKLAGGDVGTIVTYGGTDKVTTGTGWVGYLSVGHGNDIVSLAGSGEVENVHLGLGNDKLTTGSAWVGAIDASRGNDIVTLGTGGADYITLGRDADTIKFNAKAKSAIVDGGEGISDDLVGAKDSDTVDFSTFTKGLFIDLNGHSTVEGTDGGYFIHNFENAIGGKGKDTIIASNDLNILKGGASADTFVFETTKAAKGDTILDFSQVAKDRIDLSDMDANTKISGDQAFKFIGAAVFHKTAGELRYEKKSGDTLIHGDVNGDGKADFTITLDASITLKSGDFIL